MERITTEHASFLFLGVATIFLLKKLVINLSSLWIHDITPLVRRMEEELQRNGSCECVKAVDNWSLLDALYYMKGVLAEGQNYSLTRQFVGTYSYRGRISSGGNYIYNLVLDSKSRKSFFLHIPSNRRRSECSHYGNTYQFYVWVSLRK